MGVALGPFWLARRIAAGRTGVVWQGVHRRDSVQVAVKVLTLGKRSRAARDVFRREVGILAGLDHPNIVRIWDHGEVPDPVPAGLEVEAGSPYLVMEQGRATLGDRKDPMPWSRVRRVAVDLLTALAHAHAHRVLHRDIKPANILLCPAARPGETDRVVLTDFGFAAPAGEESELVGLTPGFAAPEQLSFDARSEGPWTDLFALGCVVWRLLTGKSPFDTASVEVAIAMQAKPLPRLENVPAPVVAWLRSLLAVKVPERPASAVHALRALLMAEGGGVLELGRDWRSGRAVHPGPRNLTGAGLGLVGIRCGSVGREELKDELWAGFRAASAGRTVVVGLRGVEGVGKTHLARWLCEEAHERWGAEEWVVQGTSVAEGLVQALRRRIGLDGLTGSAARGRIGAWLEATGGQGMFESWTVARTLEVSTATGPDRWGPVTDLVRRASRRVPVVARLEGAEQMADLAAFVSFLAGRNDLALCIVATRETPGWPPLAARLPGSAKELEVPPLPPDEMDRLLGENLGLAPDLQGALAATAGCVPGVALRSLLKWIEAGALGLDEEGRWHRPGVRVEVDDAELELASAAVDGWTQRGGDAARDLIELAAVLGDEVDSAALFGTERAGGAPIDRVALQRLIDEGWWRPTRRGWAFVDPRVAEVARRRAAAGGRWARWNDVAAQVYARVPGGAAQVRRGRHLFEAGRMSDAVGPWRRGLEACLDEQPPSTSAASIAAWARALESLALSVDDERHAGPDELRVALAVAAGMPVRARRLAAALASRAEGRWPDVRSAACRALAGVRLDELDLEGARGWAAAAVSSAVRPEVRANALLGSAEVELVLGDAEAASSALEAALQAASGFGVVETQVLLTAARVAVAVDRRAEARALVQRAAATAERTGREADTWHLREVLGRVAVSRGELDVAQPHLEAALASWQKAAQAPAAHRVAIVLAQVRLGRADVSGARSVIRPATTSSLLAVRVAAAAGLAAIAAAEGDVAGLDRALTDVSSAVGARRAVLIDACNALKFAASKLESTPDRARRATQLAEQLSHRR